MLAHYLELFKEVFNFIFNIAEPFSKRKRFSAFIRSVIGSTPKNVIHYQIAFNHKSANEKQRGGLETNERLEYLGDAVLGSIVALELFKKFPANDEGFLTKTRSKIVNRAVLNTIGAQLGLEKYIISQSTLSLEKTHILGDALEALIGAVFVDKGYDAASQFVVNKILKAHIDIDAVAKDDVNFKSTLIEYCQRNKVKVSFETEEHPLSKIGTTEFISVVIIEDVVYGHGVGYSKKEAQQMASKEALDKLRSQNKV